MVSNNFMRPRGKLDRTPNLDYNKIQMGKIKSAQDYTHNGKLLVWLVDSNTDENNPANWISIMYAPTFGGATDPSSVDRQAVQSYAGTQKSYGIFAVPPHNNNFVLIAFVNGDPTRGHWFACVFKDTLTHMIPGVGANATYADGVAPAAEMNIFSGQIGNPQVNPTRPTYTPLQSGLTKQGLGADPIRGIGTSSVWRDDVPTVQGWLTPGGNQFILDDGNGTASQFVRIRTPSGTQILVSETDGHIYAISRDGNTWIELNNDGDIYMYGANNINIRADKNVNISAGQNINMQAQQGGFNFISNTTINFQCVGALNVLATGNINLQSTGGTSNIKTSGALNIQSGAAMNLLAASGLNAQSSGGAVSISSSGAVILAGSAINTSQAPVQPATAIPAGSASAATAATPMQATDIPSHEPFIRPAV